jgi:large subunit ribosomal protein L10
VNRTEKQDQIDSIRDQFDRASLSVVAEYKGLTVAQLTNLRTELRKVDGQFRVVKNSLAKRALSDHVASDLSGHFKGATGVMFSFGDPAAAAKVLKEFGKDAEAFGVSGGCIDGAVVDAAGVKAIADLPSREVLLGRLCGSLISPVSGLLNVLTGTNRKLVYALSAIADQKNG